jgi:hypothetical protein
MTTAAQAKRLLRPLLAANSDLSLVGRLLAIKPVQHILRGVFLDATSDRNQFRPTWAVVFLFHPGAGFHFNWSAEIYAGTGHGWLISEEGVDEALCEAIEREALPLLRPVQSIDDFVSFTSKERFLSTWLDGYPYRRVLIDAARGDFDAANALCEMMADQRSRSSYWAEQYDPILIHIWPHIKRHNRIALAEVLHEWEFEAVKREKLEGIWEPTPFPIETN